MKRWLLARLEWALLVVAVASFGLVVSPTDAKSSDWDKAVEAIAELLCAQPTRRAA